MRTKQELAERRDQITAEQNELCKIDVWTSEQMDRYNELEDERIEIVDKLDDLRTIERLKDDNADLARLIGQMNRFFLDVSQVEERIAQNFKRIQKNKRKIISRGNTMANFSHSICCACGNWFKRP